MPVNHSPTQGRLGPTNYTNNNVTAQGSRSNVTTDGIGRRVTINMNNENQSNNNNGNNYQDDSELSFDEDDENLAANDFRLRYLNLQVPQVQNNISNNTSNNGSNNGSNTPYLNLNENFIRSNNQLNQMDQMDQMNSNIQSNIQSNYGFNALNINNRLNRLNENDERIRINNQMNQMNSSNFNMFNRSNQLNNQDRFNRAMLSPLPPPPPPPRHLYRRDAFNQEITGPGNSTSSTLSVNRDTGNVSLSTFTNNSINLNNSILRRVMSNSPNDNDNSNNNNSDNNNNNNDNNNNNSNNNNNFNHHQQIHPSIANSNESHVPNNTSTFNFLNDINRLSSQSLYNDLNLRQSRFQDDNTNDEDNNNNTNNNYNNNNNNNNNNNIDSSLRDNYLFHHLDHSIPITNNSSNTNSRNMNINSELNNFFEKRHEIGILYDNHKIFKKNHPKKRNVDELESNDTTTNNDHHQQQPLFQNYHFDTTRVPPCSFVKSGFIYNVKDLKPNEIPFTISFIMVDYENKNISGNFHFEHLYLMKHWLSENAPDNSFINISNNNTIKFTGELIDFEKTDLRYNSSIFDNFNYSILQQDQQQSSSSSSNHLNHLNHSNHSKNFKLIYNNCITKKQLQKWKNLKPFQKLSVKELISIITCNECLTTLQENFVLIKLSIDCRDDETPPIMLICVDRRSGELELVSAEGKQKSIAEEYANNLDVNKLVRQNENYVTRMTMKCKKYVSPSLKFS